MKKLTVFAALFAALILALPACKSRPDVQPEPVAEEFQRVQFITATGNGTLKEGQNKLMAKRAAMLDAERHLAEQLMGVQISSKTAVRDFVTQSDEIKTQAMGYLKGVEVISNEEIEPGIFEAQVKLNLDEFYKWLDAQE